VDKREDDGGTHGDVEAHQIEQVVVPQPGWMTRRRLLRLGSAAAAGAGLTAAASVVGARRVAADGPDILLGNGPLGSGNNAGTSQTSITAAPGSASTLNVFNTSLDGSAIYGQRTGANGISSLSGGSIIGDTNKGSGVAGLSTGGNGAQGVSGGYSGISAVAGVIGDTNVAGRPGAAGLSASSLGPLGFPVTTAGSEFPRPASSATPTRRAVSG
jgi:hypothetical protein